MKALILLLSTGFLGIISASVNGCTAYRLGPLGQLPFHTLYVETVANESFASQAQALLTENLIEAFLRDGAVQIVDQSQADATLRVTLSRYDRSLSAIREEDTVLGRSFGLTLEAEATLVDNRKDKTYFSARKVSTREEAFVDSGLQQAEYQTMPILTRNLARQIKDTVVSVW